MCAASRQPCLLCRARVCTTWSQPRSPHAREAAARVHPPPDSPLLPSRPRRRDDAPRADMHELEESARYGDRWRLPTCSLARSSTWRRRSRSLSGRGGSSCSPGFAASRSEASVRRMR
eukprot:2885006-Prymnesium_polylepis.2